LHFHFDRTTERAAELSASDHQAPLADKAKDAELPGDLSAAQEVKPSNEQTAASTPSRNCMA
jgi:hypothetical protein